jgi:endonuclease/exonuclease/phosphatase family metal-dependent hydrolase
MLFSTKKILFIVLSVFTFSVLFSQQTTMMTYNIRYATDSDQLNSWENRKEAMIDLIHHYQPEIFGIQEGLHHQVEYLKENLSNYAYIGAGRDDGKTLGEYSAIFFDTTIFSAEYTHTFWLSETPDQVSRGWGANYNRICTYGIFTHKATGKKVLIMNTHFDHESELAREKSADLIIQQMELQTLQKYPAVLMGDLNATPETRPIAIIKNKLKDAYVISQEKHDGPVGTFTGFDANKIIDDRIDYVFVKGLKVKSIVHIDDRRPDHHFVSDHLPVFVELDF